MLPAEQILPVGKELFEAFKVIAEQVIHEAKSDTYFQKPNTKSAAVDSKKEIGSFKLSIFFILLASHLSMY